MGANFRAADLVWVSGDNTLNLDGGTISFAAAGGGVYRFDPELPATAYLADDPVAAGARPLRYNKEDLLNPFFVAC